MPRDSTHQIGAPFWVETLQPKATDAAEFYGQLFAWGFEVSDGHAGALIARSKGRRVAGICQVPAGVPPTWLIHIRVDDIDRSIAQAEAAGGSCLIPTLDRGMTRRVAVLADPCGIPFCVNDGRSTDGTEVTGEVDTWSMASLHSPDRHISQHFYHALFGWELHEVDGATFSRWSLDERTIGLFSESGDTPPHWAVNVTIGDADTTAALTTSLGGSVMIEPFDTESHRNIVIADPAGAVLACSASLEN